MKKNLLCVFVSLWLMLLSGCERTGSTSSPTQVTLYCSVDEVYAKPIIHDLEKKTGLKINVLYDTEAAKTAGLANRIRAERNRPQGDVFWSSALLQTLLLKREGLLQPYKSPAAKDIPAAFKDPTGAWTGMGVRARVLVRYGDIGLPPRSLEDLAKPEWKLSGISNPQFGTASDWVAALATRWGVPKTLSYFRALKKNGVQILPGNSVVADRVGAGTLDAGVTDSDDYLAQKHKGGEIICIDDSELLWGQKLREPKATNAVLVPGSVALLKGAPHPAAAQRLLDALVAVETERRLTRQMPGVLSLRQLEKGTVWHFGNDPLSGVELKRHHIPNDTARWPAAWDKIREPLAEILLSD